MVKKNENPTKIAENMSFGDTGISNVREFMKIFPSILIKTKFAVLHKALRVKPLSEVPKIVSIKKDSSASIKENIT